ncbi:zf-HC2 domain-containing protein [Sphingomonas sp. PR090111-T3T-6A]|uniref:zf-HC2 domain-containing protein n=1 Tax=Sphingomonas sp. PR090111-T3T-6A TaxID=685778 RepID=UPI0003796683|nr:zf-HC2 domain-containing protein [Sphingomonas sp. PR090111-T3T-6A]
MGNILRFNGNPHLETERLLPWYVTGQLDPEDRLQVEAHLAECEECRAELMLERKLGGEVARLPIGAGLDWEAFSRHLDPAPPPAAPEGRVLPMIRRALARPGRTGWFLSAQAAFIAALAVLIVPVLRPAPAPYHALGAAPTPANGNAIVIFRPDTSEQALRETLNANGARLVDGPTAADAYVLHLPAERRDAVIARLRADHDIVLAEPINAGATP